VALHAPPATVDQPRQFLPSSQSTPTSLEYVKAAPGTPFIEPDVSSTINMLGF
jgi:hypothetical protein